MTFQVWMAIFSLIGGYGLIRAIGAPLKIAVPFGIACAAFNGLVIVPHVKEYPVQILTACGLVMLVGTLVLVRGARRRNRR